jgi:hypothetical protein
MLRGVWRMPRRRQVWAQPVNTVIPDPEVSWGECVTLEKLQDR